ncbi:LLM class flavin-dependent oxidoreductase [Nocardioides sp. SOB77]|uniref:LLM class flavin-dependent oxidoreductase n=1 Tax=Nocardioides oceani TaxID=3058369 RepID=A0ABT8FLU4_9ACTN|nr:LLM class flavin-dependent oxidoreductase [Nocardioides oceani]MDN4175481.1 LLM class flavin-dependent oxidoreductase [Nocardioides oceani]
MTAPLALHWFLPTSGDSRGLVGAGQGVPQDVTTSLADTLGTGSVRDRFRPPTIDYLADVARTAERLGFEGVLTPTGTFCEDAWLTTAALVRETSRLKFLVAFRPGVVNPVLAAQMAATYQRISDGRLMLNVVTGGEPTEQARFGDTAPKDERYARTDEFLEVVRGTRSRAPFDFDGAHYRAEGALVSGGIDPVPPVYFGGSSAAAGPVAARHADVYLTWGEPPEQVAEKVAWVRGLAAEQGRTLRFGLRVHTLSRDTSEEAWGHAQWLLDGVDPATVEAAQAAQARSESTGQQRMNALRRTGAAYSSAHELEISPGLWAGVGLVRGGAGTSLVGSHEEVADLIEAYHRVGIDELVLSGYPHVEEASWFAEGVMPHLRRRGLLGGAPARVPVAASA